MQIIINGSGTARELASALERVIEELKEGEETSYNSNNEELDMDVEIIPDEEV
jgi:hypothetical protein